MLELTTIMLSTFHLLCVSVASAGPLVCVWLDWREARGERLAGEAGRFLAFCALGLLLVGGLLGTALGALLWDPTYLAVLRRLPAKVHGGVWELLFSLVLLGIYAIWWRFTPDAGRFVRIVRSVLAVLLGTNLLYHFPVLFGVISQLVAERAVDGGEISSAAFRQLLLSGPIGSQAVHFVLASLAVTGVTLIGYAAWRHGQAVRSGSEPDPALAGLARTGGWIALLPSLAQIPVGIWVLMRLPDTGKRQLMGNDLLGTCLLLVSMLAALWLMHQLSAVALGHAQGRKWWLAVGAMVLVVLLMSAMARRTRPPAPSGPQSGAASGPQAAPARHGNWQIQGVRATYPEFNARPPGKA